MWQRIIDCLGLAVRVRTTAEPDVVAQLAAVLRSYASSTAAIAIDYLLEATPVPRLVRDNEAQSEHELPIDLVPAFEIDLYRRVLTLAPGIPLHAGAVVDAGGLAMIVAGPSGAGKSTLIRALLERGYRYLSEECVLLVGEGRCRGLARALNVDDETLAPPTGYTSDDYVLRGRAEKFRMFHPPEAVMWRRDAQAACVISIEHEPEAPNELVKLAGGGALLALWPAMFRHEPEILARVEEAFAGIPMYRLRTSRPEHALDRVLSLAQELGLARP